MWEQTPTPVKSDIMENPPVYLWSPRGRLIILKSKKEIKEYTMKRWREPTSDEVKRFKPGDYNPMYDFGENMAKEGLSDDINVLPVVSLGEYLEVINV